MKPRLVLLYTRDRNFDRVLKEALLGTRAVVLITRSLDAMRKIVFYRGEELDLAILDFNQGFHGMTVLNALNDCDDKLPTLAASSKGEDDAGAITFAKKVRVCLSKPFSSALLAKAIASLCPTQTRPAVA
jgi:DNA-binding response OmpR family regulator